MPPGRRSIICRPSIHPAHKKEMSPRFPSFPRVQWNARAATVQDRRLGTGRPGYPVYQPVASCNGPEHPSCARPLWLRNAIASRRSLRFCSRKATRTITSSLSYICGPAEAPCSRLVRRGCRGGGMDGWISTRPESSKVTSPLTLVIGIEAIDPAAAAAASKKKSSRHGRSVRCDPISRCSASIIHERGQPALVMAIWFLISGI
jgi:hypothetical protein